jgi:uncharacterized membrane protein YbaN (DUF454 family)
MREKFNNYTNTRPRTRKVVGWFLVVFGIIGLIAPIIPGAPILYFGLEVLGLRIVFMDKIKDKIERIFIRKDKITPMAEAFPDEAVLSGN